MRVAARAGSLAAFVLLVVLWISREPLRFRYILWRDFERLEANAQGFPEYLHEPTGIVFVRVPGGTFSMGTGIEERERILQAAGDPEDWGDEALNAAEVASHEELKRALESEGPRHLVTLSPFFVAKYEVTRAQWTKAMEGGGAAYPQGDDLPVAGVSFDECLEFCRRTSLSLPTEAEWEYACRAGTTGSFAGTGRLDDMGWCGDGEGRVLHRGGEKLPNGFGLFDMHGNVEEWCHDFLDPSFYSRPEASGPDPVCERPSPYRIVRGGSFEVVDWCSRSGRRGWLEPRATEFAVGFRPVFRLCDRR